jgi:hypothetical protein
MNDEDADELDYESLDDLPLMDHIEWNHRITKETSTGRFRSVMSVSN